MQPLRALAGMRSVRGVLLLHVDGSATALQPKPLAAQVAAITQRKHYRAALGVARDELARLPPDSAEATAARDMIARTSAKFAAHLLERACEPEAAMQQYLQTIGCARPLTPAPSPHPPPPGALYCKGSRAFGIICIRSMHVRHGVCMNVPHCLHVVGKLQSRVRTKCEYHEQRADTRAAALTLRLLLTARPPPAMLTARRW